MAQVYLDLVDGFHIKVKPLRWDTYTPGTYELPCVRVLVQESAHGYHKGEELQRPYHDLFCIAGHSSVSGKIRAVAPDLDYLERSLV